MTMAYRSTYVVQKEYPKQRFCHTAVLKILKGNLKALASGIF
jgi:hypothetical protein